MRTLPVPLLFLLAACGHAPSQPAGNAPAPAGSPAPALPDVATASFRCGDLLTGARFDNRRGTVVLTPGPGRLVLAQAMSASGARYGDDRGNEFWNKGNDATLVLGGQRHECTVTDQVSPWDQARERAAVFRGLGTEPFWSLEVGGGNAPRIRLELDMGQRPLTVDRAVPLPGRAGFHGMANDGSAVDLRITAGDCSDGMSDQTYPAAVALDVGGDIFQGCGAFLDR